MTSRPNPGKFATYLPRLLAGERVLIAGQPRNRITGNLGSFVAVKGKYRVKTVGQADGRILTWLEPKTPPTEPKETPMEMPHPPHKSWKPTQGKYGPALASLIEGHVIRIEGLTSEHVVPALSRDWIKSQGFIVRSSTVAGGCVVWIAKR